MTPKTTVFLSRSDVQELIDFKDLIPALEQVFCQYANGQTMGTGLLHLHAVDGEFHIKAGGNLKYLGVKVNGGFFQNQARYGMPAIQGCIVLSDATSGYPLAVLDSVEITGQRTAATTALAALRLAKKPSRVLTVFGTGRQARLHVEGLVETLGLQHVYLIGRDQAKAEHLAHEMALLLAIGVEATKDAAAAVRESDIVVTCTPSRGPLFSADDVRPGTFVAAIGADGPGKQELDPALFERGKLVVDILSQCSHAGELQHALASGLLTKDQVHAELGEVMAGKKPGRVNAEEIMIFDSTGTALQDVAAAALVYERAIQTSRGSRINLFA